MSHIHVPVMLKEIFDFFSCLTASGRPLRYFDGTFGRGGHLRALLEQFPQIEAVAFDRDREAIEYGAHEFARWIEPGRVKLVHANYSDFADQSKELNLGLFDMMLLDLGVSSPQLDVGRRGFSFYQPGPLDMRMNQSEGRTAAEVIHEADEQELLHIFQDYGEIQRPHRVIRALIHDRKTKNFESTQDLAGLIERVDGWHRKGHHPATQYFQALRIEVNQELSHLENSLRPLVLGLKPKGRLAVLTFHSLEDRIVKNMFKSFEDLGKPVNKKVVQPAWAESKNNSRARSAKLRVFERAGNETTEL